MIINIRSDASSPSTPRFPPASPDGGPRGPNPDRRAATQRRTRPAPPRRKRPSPPAPIDATERDEDRDHVDLSLRHRASLRPASNIACSSPRRLRGNARRGRSALGAIPHVPGSPFQRQPPAEKRTPPRPRRSETAAPRHRSEGRTEPCPAPPPARRIHRFPTSAASAIRAQKPPQKKGCKDEQKPNRGEQRQVGHNFGRQHRAQEGINLSEASWWLKGAYFTRYRPFCKGPGREQVVSTTPSDCEEVGHRCLKPGRRSPPESVSVERSRATL